jgi:hypothetical protein
MGTELVPSSRQFSLQPSCHFVTLDDVRKLLATCLLMICISPMSAQEQERKLVDRLLKPDTTLQDSAQNKKFVADRTLVDKRAHVSTFYLQKKATDKNSSGTRDFSTQPFTGQSSNAAQGKTANISSRTAVQNSRYTTAPAKRFNQVHDANKTRSTNDFSGNRPFLGQGKSQKSLHRENPPLTIEQVRELLNKNK